MISELKLAEFTIEVTEKDIKNVHLSVNPPDGKVKISAPAGTSLESVRIFALSKLSWIRQEHKKISEQLRETPREFVDRESHYVWGERYLLKVIEFEGAPAITLKGDYIFVTVRPGTSKEQLGEIIEQWYRNQAREAASQILLKWQEILNVNVSGLFIQKMKTKWGSCNPVENTIRLNTNLATKPRELFEYVIVHEMAHLIAPDHKSTFSNLMDKHLPNWRDLRSELNRLPVPQI